MKPVEHKVVIDDDLELTSGDVMTLRAALNNFNMWLDEPETIKGIGIELQSGYKARTNAILTVLSTPL